MNKLPIDQIVIVEGKYDKIALENIIDATILTCEGFGIFKNEEQRAALKSLARDRGAIILTDSDRAGAVIRSHLQTILQGVKVYTLYIPPIAGKEKRKTTPSKEGLLGVEGIDAKILRNLFLEFKAEPITDNIKAIDLYELGLTGQSGSKEKKQKLLRSMMLPQHLSNNALLKELNRKFDKETLIDYVENLK